MKVKPILFNTEMVKAVLEGRKTHTRRIMKMVHSECPNCDDSGGYPVSDGYGGCEQEQCEYCWTVEDSLFNVMKKCPYGKIGDQLWVRETHWLWGHWEKYQDSVMNKERWKFIDQTDLNHPEVMDVDGIPGDWATEKGYLGYHIRPSIFMKRKYSRIQLEITGIAVERVQDISEEDVWAEGINKEEYEEWLDDAHCVAPAGSSFDSPVDLFERLWNSINGKPRKDGTDISWASNPWVWVIEFKRLEK